MRREQRTLRSNLQQGLTCAVKGYLTLLHP